MFNPYTAGWDFLKVVFLGGQFGSPHLKLPEYLI